MFNQIAVVISCLVFFVLVMFLLGNIITSYAENQELIR